MKKYVKPESEKYSILVACDVSIVVSNGSGDGGDNATRGLDFGDKDYDDGTGSSAEGGLI